MESLTKAQFESLLDCKLHPTLPAHIKSDIEYVKTVLLTAEGGRYYVEYVELEELCDEEIKETMTRGHLIRLSV